MERHRSIFGSYRTSTVRVEHAYRQTRIRSSGKSFGKRWKWVSGSLVEDLIVDSGLNTNRRTWGSIDRLLLT